MGRMMKKRLQLRPRTGGISIDRSISFAVGEVDPEVLARTRGPVFPVRDGWEARETFNEIKALAREAREQGRETEFLDALDRRETVIGGDAAPAVPLFREFAREWEDVVLLTGAFTESEVLSTRSILKSHLVPFFGKHRLGAIDARLIDRYKAAKLRQEHQFGVGYAPRTINNHLSVLRRVLVKASEYGLVDGVVVGPKAWLPPDRTAEDTDNWLRPDEEALLVCWLLDNWLDRPRRRLPILTSLVAGLRFSELRALEKADLDVGGHGLHVRRSRARRATGTPKNKRARFQPLPPPVVEDLRRYMLQTEGQLLFPGKMGGTHSNSAFNRRLREACRLAGVREVTSHGLRRAAGSSYAYLGHGQRVVADLLGHSDVKSTERYTRVYDKAKHHAVAERWTRMTTPEDGEGDGGEAGAGDGDGGEIGG